MGAKKNLFFCKPRIECHVPFQLPKGKSSADPDMETNDITIHIAGTLVQGDADTIDILGQVVTRRDVIVHGDAAKRRSRVNRDDAVLVIDGLEGLQEVADERLDRIIGNGIGRVMDVDTDKGVILGVHVIVFCKDAMCENGWGNGQRGQRASIRRRAGVGSVAHHHGWLGIPRVHQPNPPILSSQFETSCQSH